MLRNSLLRGRFLSAGAAASRIGPQWQSARSQYLIGAAKRSYADNKKVDDAVPPQPTGSTPTVSPTARSTIVASDASKVPPAPQPASTIPPTGTITASITPPPKKKRRFLRLLFNLIILSVLGYGLGVYYALTSDNWHDFFTEYVPFGEDAVAYFEEREFRRRFLSKESQNSRLHTQVRGEPKVIVPGRAGVSARTADDGSDLAGKGRHVSAVEEASSQRSSAQAVHISTAEKEASAKPTDSKTHQHLLPRDAGSDDAKEAKSAASSEKPKSGTPATPVDNLKVENATEPVVQDVVKILNDLITVINADNAGSKYSSAIEKAKGDLSKVVANVNLLKETHEKATENKIKSIHGEFDDAARELLKRQEQAIQDQEMRWREEYETERESLNQAYEARLKAELDAAGKVYEQKLKNELLKQSIALQRDFSSSVRQQVENERSGRLGKLDELSSGVQELEKLTAEWNAVVDSNLRTQHLLVAVEAVRAALDSADRPKPFIVELAALKEVAADDPVVNAAIASLNPAAYQRGIATSAQLIDRFRRVAAEVRKASLLPDNAGVASHAASLLLSKVMFRKGGLPIGDDVESVLARSEALLEEGRLEDAVREMNALTGWAKTLSRDWLGECRRVLEVQQALDVIAAEARLQSLLVD